MLNLKLSESELQKLIELHKEIKEKHPELHKIYIIRDNARYYTAQIVKNELES